MVKHSMDLLELLRKPCQVTVGREVVGRPRIAANAGPNGQDSDARRTYCSYQPEAKM